MNLSIIIIEANPADRSAFCIAATTIPGVKVMGDFAEIRSALAFIKKCANIDVIFCELESSKIDGVHAISFFKSACQSFVCITADRKQAFEALAICADGCLIKPINQLLLHENLNALQERKRA